MNNLEYSISYYINKKNEDKAVELFFDARNKCFKWISEQLQFNNDYKVKLDLIETVFNDTDETSVVKTLRITAKPLVGKP